MWHPRSALTSVACQARCKLSQRSASKKRLAAHTKATAKRIANLNVNRKIARAPPTPLPSPNATHAQILSQFANHSVVPTITMGATLPLKQVTLFGRSMSTSILLTIDTCADTYAHKYLHVHKFLHLGVFVVQQCICPHFPHSLPLLSHSSSLYRWWCEYLIRTRWIWACDWHSNNISIL